MIERCICEHVQSMYLVAINALTAELGQPL